jgi:hypothetical protein
MYNKLKHICQNQTISEARSHIHLFNCVSRKMIECRAGHRINRCREYERNIGQRVKDAWIGDITNLILQWLTTSIAAWKKTLIIGCSLTFLSTEIATCHYFYRTCCRYDVYLCTYIFVLCINDVYGRECWARNALIVTNQTKSSHTIYHTIPFNSILKSILFCTIPLLCITRFKRTTTL